MRVLRPRRGMRNPTLSLEAAEASLIVHLAGQVSSLLRSAANAGDPKPADADDSTGVPAGVGDGADGVGWASDHADVPTPADPALLRLLPDAYCDDESSREFRRFTSDDLAAQKVANLARVVDDVRSPTPGARSGDIELSPDRLDAWLRALTDLRLVLASRLGMDADGEVPIDAAPGVHDVYDWLGFLQESILDVAG